MGGCCVHLVRFAISFSQVGHGAVYRLDLITLVWTTPSNIQPKGYTFPVANFAQHGRFVKNRYLVMSPWQPTLAVSASARAQLALVALH